MECSDIGYATLACYHPGGEMQRRMIACLCLASVLTFSSGYPRNMYDAVIHQDVTLSWNTLSELDLKNDAVAIRSTEDADVIHLVKGRPEVFPPFDGRVQLLTDGFPSGLVALKMDNVSIQDSGVYMCLVDKPLYIHPGLCHLKVRAPWSAVRKTNKSMGGGMYSLFCETEGYPLAPVVWTGGRGQNLTDWAELTTSITSEQLISVVSRLNVSISSSSSYTCTVTDDRGVSQHATFDFPDKEKSRNHYLFLIAAVLLVGVVVMLLFRYDKLSHRDGTEAQPSSGSSRAPQNPEDHGRAL
ncbi:programmed cell death 1 ligand 1-like [Sardina pilchardus]|uniref:programmed cell death 1 ligand 1-like n=1 Tax=Sardina pilchardus TaxID=27697 RepID=UPI002E15B398